MARESGDRVGIIGGGRWARVLAGELDLCLPANCPITVYSERNPASWDAWIRDHETRRTVVAHSIAAFLHEHSISHVLIARKAWQHAQTIIECLAAGKHVFVEKPFCTTRAECRRLLDALGNRSCTVGYVLLYSRSLQHFVAECRKLGEVQSIGILWADPLEDFRYGESKLRDETLSMMQDVFPHIWSIVRTFDPEATLRLESAVSLDRRRDVEYLRLSCGDCQINAVCARHQEARARQVFVRAAKGTAFFDFAAEPGYFVLNGSVMKSPVAAFGPLRAEILAFLDGPASADYRSLSELKHSTETVLIPLRALRSSPCSRMPKSELALIGDTLPRQFTEAVRRHITTVNFFCDDSNCSAESTA